MDPGEGARFVLPGQYKECDRHLIDEVYIACFGIVEADIIDFAIRLKRVVTCALMCIALITLHIQK